MENNAELFRALQSLVDAWCDRRCLKALRHMLHGYPLTSPLTDGWADLLVALQNVRAFARSELTEAESASLENCIRAVDNVVHRTESPGSVPAKRGKRVS